MPIGCEPKNYPVGFANGKKTMALELPQAPDPDVLADVAVVVDDQAGRGEAPNNQGPVIDLFHTARKGPRISIE